VLRAVLDTNVIISGLIRPQGTPGLLLESLVLDNAFEVIVSSELLEELRRAVHYEKVRPRIALSDDELELRLSMLDVLGIPVEPKPLSGAASDPDDDHVLAAAVEGGAGYVVTGDAGLLELREYQRILMVTPKHFFDLLITT
jgi:uncharacterized protein